MAKQNPHGTHIHPRPKYNNSAGRLLSLFQRMKDDANKDVKRDIFAHILGVQNSWDSIFTAIADIRHEFNLLTADIEKFREIPAQFELFNRNLPDIEKCADSFQLSIPNNTVRYKFVETGLVAIEFMAAAIPIEEAPDDSELDRFRELVTNLQKEIAAATELSQYTREWLLDLLRLIRDSLDRFAIRGGRGMRQQVSELVGELARRHGAETKEVKDKAPSIFQKIRSAIEIMDRAVVMAEKTQKVITTAQQYLPPLLDLLGLPGP